MAYVPIRSKEQACNLIDPEEQVSLLAEVRDELYDGRWNPMIRDMKREIEHCQRKTIREYSINVIAERTRIISKG